MSHLKTGHLTKFTKTIWLLAPAERNPTLRVIPNILANAVNPFITLVSATTLGRLLQNACIERGKKRVNIISSMSMMKEIASAFNKRSSLVGEPHPQFYVWKNGRIFTKNITPSPNEKSGCNHQFWANDYDKSEEFRAARNSTSNHGKTFVIVPAHFHRATISRRRTVKNPHSHSASLDHITHNHGSIHQNTDNLRSCYGRTEREWKYLQRKGDFKFAFN